MTLAGQRVVVIGGTSGMGIVLEVSGGESLIDRLAA